VSRRQHERATRLITGVSSGSAALESTIATPRRRIAAGENQTELASTDVSASPPAIVVAC